MARRSISSFPIFGIRDPFLKIAKLVQKPKPKSTPFGKKKSEIHGGEEPTQIRKPNPDSQFVIAEIGQSPPRSFISVEGGEERGGGRPNRTCPCARRRVTSGPSWTAARRPPRGHRRRRGRRWGRRRSPRRGRRCRRGSRPRGRPPPTSHILPPPPPPRRRSPPPPPIPPPPPRRPPHGAGRRGGRRRRRRGRPWMAWRVRGFLLGSSTVGRGILGIGLKF